MPTQSYPYPDHEHPQYVTLAYLEAFEGRMINRIEQRFNEQAVDLAVIKEQLKALPSRWVQYAFAMGILIPIYGILAALLFQVSK